MVEVPVPRRVGPVGLLRAAQAVRGRLVVAFSAVNVADWPLCAHVDAAQAGAGAPESSAGSSTKAEQPSPRQ